MYQLVMGHFVFVSVAAAIVFYFLFSNLVGALPKPVAVTGWYRFTYAFLHGLAGNVAYALRQFSQTSKFIEPDQPVVVTTTTTINQ